VGVDNPAAPQYHEPWDMKPPSSNMPHSPTNNTQGIELSGLHMRPINQTSAEVPYATSNDSAPKSTRPAHSPLAVQDRRPMPAPGMAPPRAAADANIDDPGYTNPRASTGFNTAVASSTAQQLPTIDAAGYTSPVNPVNNPEQFPATSNINPMRFSSFNKSPDPLFANPPGQSLGHNPHRPQNTQHPSRKFVLSDNSNSPYASVDDGYATATDTSVASSSGFSPHSFGQSASLSSRSPHRSQTRGGIVKLPLPAGPYASVDISGKLKYRYVHEWSMG
jgi:hypothetical protein